MLMACQSPGDKHSSGDLQVLILKELQGVNSGVNIVEAKVDKDKHLSTGSKNFSKLIRQSIDCTVIVIIKKCRKGIHVHEILQFFW